MEGFFGTDAPTPVTAERDGALTWEFVMSMISFNTSVSSATATSGRGSCGMDRGAVSDATLPSRVDTLEISAASQQTSIRQDLVARMRASIASGQYERDIDAKLDVVADRLGRELDEMA